MGFLSEKGSAPKSLSVYFIWNVHNHIAQRLEESQKFSSRVAGIYTNKNTKKKTKNITRTMTTIPMSPKSLLKRISRRMMLTSKTTITLSYTASNQFNSPLLVVGNETPKKTFQAATLTTGRSYCRICGCIAIGMIGLIFILSIGGVLHHFEGCTMEYSWHSNDGHPNHGRTQGRITKLHS